ncbi:MAG: chitobiase/beta-hexosaminidase C-terminal domain-containing protein [Brevinematales bacterium]|nr:chitobiase/beta-hexosaminidase C-terminal domain-containing protein [Brevinematales bacterium]
MKRSLITIFVLLTGIGILFAQQTTAPDQEGGSKTKSNTTTTKSTNQQTITEEKEVKAVEGIVYNDGNMDYASGDVKFVIEAKDQGSGVKTVYVLVDDSDFGVYENPIAFLEEGKHLIGYKVEDNVGNMSKVKFYEFILDKTAPEAILISDKKPVKIGDVLYVGSNYNFGILANDALSGVKSIEYKIDDGEAKIYKGVFAPVNQNGLHKVEYFATDNVGNVSMTKTYIYYLDITAPTIEFVINPAPFDKDGVKYISDKTPIVIKAKDTETGISRIVYTIDGGEEKDYQYPIKLANGTHTIKAKAFDLLGNASEEISLELTVDAEIPEAELIPTK